MSSDRFTGVAAGLTPQQRARIAVFRFGLGPKSGLIERLSRSPNAAFDACMAELTAPTARASALIPRSLQNGVQISEQEDLLRCCNASGEPLLSAAFCDEELARRYVKHLEPEVGFLERLVLFWSNHFSINRWKSIQVRGFIGHFERTVIRKHVLNSFPQMLSAAISHPAMIGYLDNFQSSISNPNENLAREILELYTLSTEKRYPNRSVGYEQSDVESLTRILTGWGIRREWVNAKRHPRFNEFLFNQRNHDERSQTIMGKAFSGPGQAKGFAALQWLALHSYTGQNIATKLLRHFGFDNPPEPLVSRLRHIYVHTGGNLLEVSKFLLGMEEVWAAPLRIRPPHLWVMSMARAMEYTAADFDSTQVSFRRDWQHLIGLLDNAPWEWVTPDGYPDRSEDWIHPDAMRMRVNIAFQMFVYAHSRGRTSLPAPATLRENLLPGNQRVTKPVGVSINSDRSLIGDIFLTTEFMTR